MGAALAAGGAAGVAAAAAPAAPAAAPAAAAGPTDAYAAAASNLVAGSALETTVNNLMEMGFEREQVQRALRAAFNNPEVRHVRAAGARDARCWLLPRNQAAACCFLRRSVTPLLAAATP